MTVELKTSTCGLTATFTPNGCSTEVTYVLSMGPTLVTVLVIVTEDLSFGTVIEGRLRLRIEGSLLGQTKGCSVNFEMAEVL